MRRLPLFAWFFIIAIVCFALIAMPVFVPVPAQVGFVQGERFVEFTMIDRVVFKPGDCVTVSWRVNDVRGIYFDGTGVIGEGTVEQCPETAYTSRLRIEWTDGSETLYELPVTYVSSHPLAWAAAFFGLWALLAGLYALGHRLIGQRLQALDRPVRLILLAALCLGAALLLLEFGLRWYFTEHGTPTERRRYLSLPDARLNEADRRFFVQPVPLINWLPSLSEVNRLGYRGEMVEIPKPPGVYRIAALGGSTTYGTGTTAENSYPVHLQRILRDDYGYSHVEIVNAGVPSWNTWHSLSNLAFRVLETEPDMIIIFHAINDVFPRVMPERCYDGIRPYLGLPPNAGFYNREAFDYGPSTLLRFIGIHLGWFPDPAGQATGIEAQFEIFFCNEGRTNDMDVLRANPPVYFERNLRSMIGMAQAHNVDVMLASWTYYELRDFEVLGVQQHNAITAALAQELSLPFYDLAADFPRNIDLWASDYQHMNGAGSRVQAELFAAFMHDNALIPPVE